MPAAQWVLGCAPAPCGPIYQPTYLAGMVAARATQTGRIGAVLPIRLPETARRSGAGRHSDGVWVPRAVSNVRPDSRKAREENTQHTKTAGLIAFAGEIVLLFTCFCCLKLLLKVFPLLKRFFLPPPSRNRFNGGICSHRRSPLHKFVPGLPTKVGSGHKETMSSCLATGRGGGASLTAGGGQQLAAFALGVARVNASIQLRRVPDPNPPRLATTAAELFFPSLVLAGLQQPCGNVGKHVRISFFPSFGVFFPCSSVPLHLSSCIAVSIVFFVNFIFH